MTQEFKRERRYVVLKLKDADNIPNPVRERLDDALREANQYLPDREYVVIESDWPEYEVAWKMIEARCGGAAQAQQTTADAGRVLEWMRTPDRKPANLAFTDGPERQAAYWIEIAQQRVAQQTTEEPELPERYDFVRDTERGVTEDVYTATQMHDHYQAGVRAGAAGSQDANEEVVTITVPLSHINSLQVESIKRLVARTKHAHMTDVRIRINGNYEYFEADWLKYVVIGGGA